MASKITLEQELDDILWNIKQEEKRVSEIKSRLYPKIYSKNLRSFEERKKETGKDKCVCGHTRDRHGKSHNINYTDGACRDCKGRNFLMK